MLAELTTPAGRFDVRLWARWLGTFVGFPLAGLAAKAAVGPIDSTSAAMVGGLAGGAVLGAVQSLALRRSAIERVTWTAATACGLAVGLAAGATLVDFRTDTASLVAMGLLSGAGVGLAQAIADTLEGRGRATTRVAWAVTTSVLWGLGWLITSQVIVDTDSRYATFGASGALVAAAFGGLVLVATGSDATIHPINDTKEHP